MRSIKKSKQNNDVIDLISVISIEYKNEMSRLIRQCQFYDEEETGQWRDRSNGNDRTCPLNTENETELSYPIQQGIIYNKDLTGQRCDWSYRCGLDVMDSSGLLMTWATLGHELRALDFMNSFGLWLTWMTLGRELRALDAMNSLGLWLTWTTLGHELKALNAMNQHKGVHDMNDS